MGERWGCKWGLAATRDGASGTNIKKKKNRVYSRNCRQFGVRSGGDLWGVGKRLNAGCASKDMQDFPLKRALSRSSGAELNSGSRTLLEQMNVRGSRYFQRNERRT